MSDENQEPEESDEGEAHGVFHTARVAVQCMECGSVLEGDIDNPNPEDDTFVDVTQGIECPACTRTAGTKVVIPVVVVVGGQVWTVFDPLTEGQEAEEDEPASFSPDVPDAEP